jgi:hypothetical protein
VKKSGMPPQSFTGPSLLEMLWERMDRITAKILEGDNSDKTVGKAIGLSEALAIFTNPYDPKPKAIRTEAKDRYVNRVRSRSK